MTAAAKKVPALPAPHSVAAVINRLIVVAASQIGYREGRSSSGSWNNDTHYGAWYGLNRNAWCAMFVSWCADVAGLTKVIPKHAYTPSGYNWFAARKQTVSSPRRGDILYVYGPVRGEAKPRIHHIGIVENVLSGGYITTIEGNTNTSGSASGNGVYRLKRKVTSRLRFARPNYAAAVVAPPKPKPKPPAKPGTPKPAAPRPDVDRFGQPRTGGSPKTDSAKKQILELNVLVAGAKFKGTPTYTMYAQVAAAVRSLKAMGLMPPRVAPTGQNFRAGWAKWQQQLGYRGKDADGIPGTASFSRFIERTGRSRKSPGYKAK